AYRPGNAAAGGAGAVAAVVARVGGQCLVCAPGEHFTNASVETIPLFRVVNQHLIHRLVSDKNKKSAELVALCCGYLFYMHVLYASAREFAASNPRENTLFLLRTCGIIAKLTRPLAILDDNTAARRAIVDDRQLATLTTGAHINPEMIYRSFEFAIDHQV